MALARRLVPTLVVLAAGCGGSRGERAVSAVLVTLDTTRADALGCYGAPRPTPTLDRLATQSVLYEAAFTVAPITQPAHASMLTGLYPLRHGIRDNGLGSLPGEARTLAEAAHEAGLETAAFVAAVVLDRSFGLDQGFDVYDAPARPTGSDDGHMRARDATAVVGAALAWLAARDPARRFFLWVHLFDPHGPYEPPPRFREGSSRVDLYRGEVAYADAELGRLLDGLGEHGGAHALLVVGDHGEALGEHGESTHGAYCYDATLRVPLLLRHPDGRRAGERSREVVSVVDVCATLADALGLEPGALAPQDGQSLYRNEVPGGRGVYFESYSGYLTYGWSPLAGWLDAEGKYLHSSEPELYDREADPAEGTNLVADGGARAERYRAAIADLAARPRLTVNAGALDPELAEELRGLGYAASEAPAAALPEPLAPSPRPSPASRAGELEAVRHAQVLGDQGQLAEAEAILGRVVAENPANAFALDRLATCLIRQERHAEALPLLERVVAGGPQWAGTYFNLGVCLQVVGRAEEALAALARAHELKPAQPLFRQHLVASLRAAGRDEEADAIERGTHE